jgi:hypothetical protein
MMLFVMNGARASIIDNEGDSPINDLQFLQDCFRLDSEFHQYPKCRPGQSYLGVKNGYFSNLALNLL